MDIHIKSFVSSALPCGNIAKLHLGIRKSALDGLPEWVKKNNNIAMPDVFSWYHDLSMDFREENRLAKDKYGSNTLDVLEATGPIPHVVAILEHSGRFTYVPDEPEIRASISDSMLSFLKGCELFAPHVNRFGTWVRTFPGAAWRQNYEPY